MDRDAYKLMLEIERDHWWYRARRKFIRAAFERANLPANARMLDAGCGSGGNLPVLAEFGTVSAFEYDEQAARHAAAANNGDIQHGSLPDHMPFVGQQFDGIGLFDVLEHMPRPVDALNVLRNAMAPGGCLVITVPANQWMFGPHDTVHQHYLRYSRKTLLQHLTQANLRVEYVSYFNSILFPLAIAQRLREKLFGFSADDIVPSPIVNRLLFRLWSLERAWIPTGFFPFGLSLIAMARRGND